MWTFVLEPRRDAWDALSYGGERLAFTCHENGDETRLGHGGVLAVGTQDTGMNDSGLCSWCCFVASIPDRSQPFLADGTEALVKTKYSNAGNHRDKYATQLSHSGARCVGSLHLLVSVIDDVRVDERRSC